MNRLFSEEGVVREVGPIRQVDGKVATRFGRALRIAFTDGRTVDFSEGSLPYHGTLPPELLIGRRMRWSLLRGFPLSSELVPIAHCAGCDHDDPSVRRYRVELTEGETISADWCTDCAAIARAEGDGIVSVAEMAR